MNCNKRYRDFKSMDDSPGNENAFDATAFQRMGVNEEFLNPRNSVSNGHFHRYD